LPVLPYLYLLGAWSLLELVRSARWKTVASLLTLVIMVWSLVNQPFSASAEFNLRYLDVIRVHKEMCELISSEFADARVLTAWPHTVQLEHPYLGYVKKGVRVGFVSGKDLRSSSFEEKVALRQPDLILISTVPVTSGMEELRAYAVKHNWRLIRRLVNEPVATELYGRPQLASAHRPNGP